MLERTYVYELLSFKDIKRPILNQFHDTGKLFLTTISM